MAANCGRVCRVPVAEQAMRGCSGGLQAVAPVTASTRWAQVRCEKDENRRRPPVPQARFQICPPGLFGKLMGSHLSGFDAQR